MINNRQAGRRRGRGGQRSQGGNPGRGPENGNRIDNRARGNAAQLLEKYKTLARDAQMQGDRVNTEYYLQFADHYFRVLAETRSRFEENQPRRGQNDQFDDGDDDDFDGSGEPMAEDRVDQYTDRNDRGGNDRGGNGNDRGNADRGHNERQQRDGGREASRDNGNRDSNRQAPRGNDRGDNDRSNNGRDGNGYDGQGNGARNSQRDAGQDRQPRRYEADGATESNRDEAPAAASATGGDADRPRRARPRRVATPEADRDEGPAAIEADRLPASLTISATVDDDGEKPRRRRGRPAASEVTSAE